MSQVRAVRIVQVAKNIDRALHCAAGRAVRDWAPPSGTRGYISTPGPSLVGGAGPSAVAPPTQKGSCTLAALGADYSLRTLLSDGNVRGGEKFFLRVSEVFRDAYRYIRFFFAFAVNYEHSTDIILR